MFDNYQAKPDAVRAALDEAPKIGESLCAECSERFAVVRRDLDATGVEYRLEPTLVRGLDYYSRTTWEFVGPLENENATLSGGGRYDYLVEEIGGPPTPGVGFGAGIERLLLALEAEGVTTDAAPDDRRLLRAGRRARRESSSPAGSPSSGRSGVSADTDYAEPLAQGPAHAGGPPRSGDDRRRRPPACDVATSRAAPTRTSRTTSFPRDCRDETWRDVMCGEPRSEHVGQTLTLGGLGGHAPRPRRARVRRPARPHGRHPARDQSRALPGRRRAREGDPQRVRPPGARRGRRARARDGQRGDADGRGRAPGRRARDRLALDAAPVPARRGGRRRDAAPPLPLARPAHAAHAAEHAAVAHRDLLDPTQRWTGSGSSTSGRRA